MIFINSHWIGINTLIPNRLVYEAIIDGKIPQLDMYTIVKRKVKYKDSRFDIFAKNNI